MSEAYNYAEYDSLVSEESSLKDRKKDYENKESDLEDKITRLKTAKGIVSDIKDNVKEIRSFIKKAPESQHEDWEGAKFNEVKSSSESDYLKCNYDNYIESIDTVEDRLNDEITRLENEKLEVLGLIGDVISIINNIANKIRNFFN